MRLWYLGHPQPRIDPAVPVPDCVPQDRHEALADRFFAEPDRSADGWETARAAQARVLADLRRALAESRAGDTLVVGHGGVGTPILCHFAGLAPSRRHGQPAGGGTDPASIRSRARGSARRSGSRSRLRPRPASAGAPDASLAGGLRG